MHGAASQSAGEDLFASQQHVIDGVIAFVCSRTPYLDDRDDFRSWVHLKILEDDFAILRKFQGRSSWRTYLSVVIQRLLLDYQIGKWGKYRPSAEARRAGPVAVLLEQLIVRDGHPFEAACEIVVTNHRVGVPRAELERLAARLPARVKRRMEREDVLLTLPSRDRATDDVVAEGERQRLADRLSAALRGLLARFETQDRLILTLRFEDGRAISEIATLVGLEPKPLYRRMERLLRELRSGLEAEGIEGAAVLEMLESPAVSIEWGSEAKEIVMTSPSMSRGAR